MLLRFATTLILELMLFLVGPNQQQQKIEIPLYLPLNDVPNSSRCHNWGRKIGSFDFSVFFFFLRDGKFRNHHFLYPPFVPPPSLQTSSPASKETLRQRKKDRERGILRPPRPNPDLPCHNFFFCRTSTSTLALVCQDKQTPREWQRGSGGEGSGETWYVIASYKPWLVSKKKKKKK